MDAFLASPAAGPLLLILAPLLYMVLLGIHRRREGLRHHLRKVIVRVSVYLLVAYLLFTNGANPLLALGIGALCGFGAEALVVPKRSRHIRQAERRLAIARWQIRNPEEKFNPRKHELDHVVPYSRFGSSTADNLRVVERHANRRKGKKSPWWDVLGSSRR